jgi:hypothetical protein
VLHKIELESGFGFFVNSKNLDLKRKVSVSVSNKNIFQVLEQVFKGVGIEYKVLDNKIVLAAKEKDVAQQRKERLIAGTVKDKNGEPLIGVSIREKSSGEGTITDMDGNYKLSTSSANPVLVFSYVGYQSKEVPVKGNVANVVLEDATQELNEVVVTALGIKRSEKALSYNVQQLSGDELTTVKDANFISSLNDKFRVDILSSAIPIQTSGQSVHRTGIIPIINGRAGEYGSASMIEFDNGSFIESIPTSSEAGRSESLSLLVIDEAAVVRWAAQIWAAAFPTLSTGGAAIVNSTPYGVGNFYHSTWVDAIAGGNPFNPIRLYWQMHPERDINWYNQMSSALGAKRTAQEIDGDFLSSGNTVFDLADIKAIEDCLSDYPVIKKRFNGQYRQFCEPESDKEYFIGADVSTGRASDYSSFTCMDKLGEEQVVYKGRMAVGAYAKLLGDTGKLFNWAVIAPESNDVGLSVTSKLQDEGYPNLYYYQKMLKKKGKSRPEMDKSPGWLTTQKNRSVIIENLEEDIRLDHVIIKDPFFVQEAYTFIYDGLGRPVAMGKHRANNSAVDVDLEGDVYADDDIFGKAICNHIRKGKTNVIVQPR